MAKKKEVCACGNPSCKVAELEAKMPQLRAAFEKLPTRYSWGGSRSGREATAYFNAVAKLNEQTAECETRQALLRVGPTCPYCARPVLQYGEAATPTTCGISGPTRWRGNRDALGREVQAECLTLAWNRLKGVDNG